jgi:type IV pilus assembly protein PilM
MPKSDAVWGIDIGQCALKALRCRPHDEAHKIVADAFDYIEYPQMLNQPGADPAKLIGDALTTFLSRNTVKGDKVAISVPGQNGLARFIKLPPVEAKKIPDIVRYEARQQIPFDLNDVIWDYQRMGGGSEEEGFALETEIGLFAIKREQVFRALEPFRVAGIEPDIVQLTPLALYNYLLFDQLTDLPPPEEFDPENPPPSTVVLSVGTDASDLVVSNGYRVWQRSIPVGGNHFTRALMKDLKLTFPKAEHLKRNATSAQDPKAVFQAMRPVFNDLLTEVQRSIGFFSSVDREAEIATVIALGNAMKLPGLRKYLEQNVGYGVVKVDSFDSLAGSSVVAAPAFHENIGCFGACYGLAIQALGKGGVRTNLLPRQLVVDRLIRRKKPWGLGVAALLLLGVTISFASFARALSTVDKKRLADDGKTTFEAAEQQSIRVKKDADDWKRGAEEATTQFNATDQIGQHLVGNVEGRFLWLELLRAINVCLPHDALSTAKDGAPAAEKEIDQRNRLYITSLDCQYFENLQDWFGKVQTWYQPAPGEAPLVAAASAGGGPDAGANPGAAAGPPGGEPGAPPAGSGGGGPQGPGWVVQLRGFHFHNSDRYPPDDQGAAFVRKTFINNLRTRSVELPLGDKEGNETINVKDLGISFPVLKDPGQIKRVTLTNPNAADERGNDHGAAPKTVEAQKFDFTVEFAWKPTRASERHQKQQAQANPK